MWAAYCAYVAVARPITNVRFSGVVYDVFDHVQASFAATYMAFAEKYLSPDMLFVAVMAAQRWDLATGGMQQYKTSTGQGVSYTATKYIALAAKLVYAFGKLPERVVEIGGGLGGFACVASSLGCDVTVVDLPATAAAIQNIAACMGCSNVKCIPSNDIGALNALMPGYTVVSEHAWTSLTVRAKRTYVDTVFAKAAGGWLTCSGDCAENTSILQTLPCAQISTHPDVFSSNDSYALSWKRVEGEFIEPVRVFVVGASAAAAAALARKLYDLYDLRAAPTRRWEMLLCRLAHGLAFDHIERALRRQSFTLFCGYPWSHPDCEAAMRQRFPEAVWVRSEDLSETCDSCTELSCNFETKCAAASGFVYTAVEALPAVLRPRTSAASHPFPCACTAIKLVDCGDTWVKGTFTQSSCFMPVPLSAAAEADLRLYVDWDFKKSSAATHARNIAWVAESPPEVPGCRQQVLAESHKFVRTVYYGGLSTNTNDKFGNVPFGGCWIDNNTIAASINVPKLPNASLIVSRKQYAPGHILRHAIVTSLGQEHPRVHVCGNGYGPHFENKATALQPFMYSIVVENCQETGYFTEKLVDCLACRCVAFYWGAPNVHEWFDGGSVSCFGTIEELHDLLRTMSAEDYAARAAAIDANQHRSVAWRCSMNGIALETDVLSLPLTVTDTCGFVPCVPVLPVANAHTSDPYTLSPSPPFAVVGTCSCVDPLPPAVFVQHVPGVSIFMPVFTGIEFLEAAVSSVIAQTYEGSWELLIGVNGHGLHSSAWVTAAVQAVRNVHIKLLHFSPPAAVLNKKSWTCNAMTAHARYDTVCMLDCDDLWAPTKLAEQMRIWETGTVDVVGTQTLYLGGGKTGTSPALPMGYFHASHNFLDSNPVINSSAMFRAQDAYWNCDVFGVEDYDLWIRLQLLGRRFFNLPEALTTHRLHDGSAFNGSNDAPAQMLRAHWQRPAALFKPVTVVTAYYQIPAKFSHATYLAWAANFLQNVPCYLQIYTSAAVAEELSALRAAFPDRTALVVMEFEDLEMATPEWMSTWRHQHTLDPEAAHHSPELYVLWAQKSACVAHAIRTSHWGSDFFVWCDIGAFRNKDRAVAFSSFPCPKLVSCLNQQRVCFLLMQHFTPAERVLDGAFLSVTNDYLRRFPYKDHLDVWDTVYLRTTDHLGGGVFVAHKDHFHVWHAAYLQFLAEAVAANRFIGKDQIAYNTLYLRHPELYTCIDATFDQGDPWFYMQAAFK